MGAPSGRPRVKAGATPLREEDPADRNCLGTEEQSSRSQSRRMKATNENSNDRDHKK